MMIVFEKGCSGREHGVGDVEERTWLRHSKWIAACGSNGGWALKEESWLLKHFSFSCLLDHFTLLTNNIHSISLRIFIFIFIFLTKSSHFMKKISTMSLKTCLNFYFGYCFFSSKVGYKLKSVVEEIKRRALACSNIVFIHIFRGDNSVADAIAKFARCEKSSIVWNRVDSCIGP